MDSRSRAISRAARLAGWIHNLALADQIFITGRTLVLEDIRTRRTDPPMLFDEVVLRESEPTTAYRLALQLADGYSGLPSAPGSDDVDENWRISNMKPRAGGSHRQAPPRCAGRWPLMVRRVTPAQLQSLIHQAEHKRRQAINKANSEIRTYNNAVDNHNRERRQTITK